MSKTEWPADKVQRRSVASLTPYARNARTHSDEQIGQIAASIGEWGWTMPILVDEAGGIIAGHGRVLAAQRLGLTEVPVMEARGWSEAQKRAYLLADNKLTLNAGWDEELLRLELGELKFDGFDLWLTGFSGLELSDLLTPRTDGLTDPDEVPDAPAVPVSQLGDVWTLGRHRLVCGDATSDADVSLCLAGVQPHLMVTDPPYGVDYDATWRDHAGAFGDGTARMRGKVEADNRIDWQPAWDLFIGDVAYVWSSDRYAFDTVRSLIDAGFEARSMIIWAKQHFALSRGHYHSQHEPCWYAVRKSSTAHWVGDRKQSTLWEITGMNAAAAGRRASEDGKTNHSTQKPVECMKRPIENNSSPGQAVYDPFVGSGTTLIAAEMTGRACHAIEISSSYCDVAIQRWQNFTGQQATHETIGRTFDEMREERLAYASA